MDTYTIVGSNRDYLKEMLMTSHLDNYSTTDPKSDMLSVV